jgi:hypothetical protein
MLFQGDSIWDSGRYFWCVAQLAVLWTRNLEDGGSRPPVPPYRDAALPDKLGRRLGYCQYR